MLIQHDQRHYDRTTGQMAYVYSMYLHLSQNSVRVSVGEHVSAGLWIAEVDDTGSGSRGNHLHLQIVVHPEPNRTLEDPFTLDSENRSRNSELWLSPINVGGTTATAIGKVTDNSGNPVGGLRVWGMQKPAGSGGTTYQWSQTYAYPWANPDDILVENFGTTDVSPGTYHLYARYANGTLFRDLGSYTFVADRSTYIGLYPIYLPDININQGVWGSSITIRNNSDTATAQVNTTVFESSAHVYSQRTDNVPPRGTVIFDPSGPFVSSAIVVASQDVSVIVRNQHANDITIYNGLRGHGGSPGWERVGSTLYVPVVKNNWYDRYSWLEVLNTGGEKTTVTVTYYLHDSSQIWGSDSMSVWPNDHTSFLPIGCQYQQYCAAVISSDNGQPLAAVVNESKVGGVEPTTYNAFSTAATMGYVPLVKKNWSSQNTGIAVMNTHDSQGTTVTVTYYGDDDDPTSSGYQGTESYWLPPRAVHSFWMPTAQPTPPLPGQFLGSAVVSAGQPVAVLVAESGSGVYKLTNGFLGGTGEAYISELFNYANYPKSGITVQNLHASQTARVWVDYYNRDGSFRQTIGPKDISAGEERVFHSWNNGLPTEFQGSAQVRSEWGQPVGVMVNEAWAAAGVGYDGHASFNGSQP